VGARGNGHISRRPIAVQAPHRSGQQAISQASGDLLHVSMLLVIRETTPPRSVILFDRYHSAIFSPDVDAVMAVTSWNVSGLLKAA